MTKQKSDIRAQIASHLQACLDLGPRGDLRASLILAADLASGAGPSELTDLAYRRLATGGRITDPTRPGFIMVANKRGGKRWLYRTQANGTQRQVTLGRYPAMTLAEARSAWAQVSSQGIKGGVSDERSQTTLGELVRHYMVSIDGNRTAQRVQSVFDKHLLPNHKDMPLSDVTAEVLESCYVHLIDSRPGAARNIHTPLSAMMRWAEEEKRLPTGMTAPRLRKTPKGKVKEFRPSSRDLRVSIKAFGEMGNVGDILLFQLLTGVRISEAREADWSEFEGRRWLIPAERMKNKKEHLVLLSDQAWAILERQTGFGAADGSVFKPISHATVMQHWSKKRTDVGLPSAYGSHTHRKALLTWVAENQGGKDIRDRLSAHHDNSSADAHYQRSQLNDAAAEWWQRWGDHIAALSAPNVVLIGEERA